jgi:hypothetical protein
MIEWDAFVVVSLASLLGASVVVAIAATGIRLFDIGIRARAAKPRSGRLALLGARSLFVVCGIVVLYGVYLIVPAFH